MRGAHGVAWFSKTPMERIMVGMEASPEWNDEGRFCAADLGWALVVLVYAPCTDGSEKRDNRRTLFCKAMRTEVGKIYKRAKRKGIPLLVCGDLNGVEGQHDVQMPGGGEYTGPGATWKMDKFFETCEI